MGGARQSSASRGQLANGHVTADCTDAELNLAWSVATRLHLPREWITEAVAGKKKPDGFLKPIGSACVGANEL